MKEFLDEQENSKLELVRLLSINLLYYIEKDILIDLETLFFGFYLDKIKLYEITWYDRILKAIKKQIK